MDRQKIAIDSLHGLIDYMMEYDLDETKKNQLRAMDDTTGLHFSLGMYIRNHYELSDEDKVPNLVREFKEMVMKDALEDAGDIDEETRAFYEFLYVGMSLEDNISGYIIKEIWKRVKTAE